MKAFEPRAVVVAVPPFAVPKTVPAVKVPEAFVARKGEEMRLSIVVEPFTSNFVIGAVVPMPTLPPL